MSWRPTIRVRLTLVHGGLFFVAGAVLLAVTYALLGHSLRDQHNGGALVARADTVIGRSPTQTFDGSDATGATPLPEAFQPVQPQGAQPAVPEAGAAGQGDQLVFTQRIQNAGELKEKIAQLQSTYENDALRALLTQGGIALLLVGAAAVGLGWVMAGRALRPVHRVTETARRVARSQDLTERIGYGGPRDDVKELADTFDDMLARLARAFDMQQRFVANASHELRTPLAINRTLVDVAIRRPSVTDDLKRLGESLLVVNARHERLIDGLLMLAGSEQEITDRTSVDLADVAGHVLDLAAPEAEENDLLVERALGPAPTLGDPVLLERLVQNLVENAVRHNNLGGRVELATRAYGDRVEVSVTNTGPVVPPYEVETMFEPFRRLRTERVNSERGSGLGLSIVRAIANAHGGVVHAEPRSGGGLAVTVRLPRSPVDTAGWLPSKRQVGGLEAG